MPVPKSPSKRQQRRKERGHIKPKKKDNTVNRLQMGTSDAAGGISGPSSSSAGGAI